MPRSQRQLGLCDHSRPEGTEGAVQNPEDREPSAAATNRNGRLGLMDCMKSWKQMPAFPLSLTPGSLMGAPMGQPEPLDATCMVSLSLSWAQTEHGGKGGDGLQSHKEDIQLILK